VRRSAGSSSRSAGLIRGLGLRRGVADILVGGVDRAVIIGTQPLAGACPVGADRTSLAAVGCGDPGRLIASTAGRVGIRRFSGGVAGVLDRVAATIIRVRAEVPAGTQRVGVGLLVVVVYRLAAGCRAGRAAGAAGRARGEVIVRVLGVVRVLRVVRPQ